MKLSWKILRIGGAGKWPFFESAILIFFSNFFIFYFFSPMKNNLAVHMRYISFISALWMVSSESRKKIHSIYYAHDCIWLCTPSAKSNFSPIWWSVTGNVMSTRGMGLYYIQYIILIEYSDLRSAHAKVWILQGQKAPQGCKVTFLAHYIDITY